MKSDQQSPKGINTGQPENLLKWTKKSPFADILTDEVIDIANIQNLVTFIKFSDEKWEAEAAFIDSTDLLHFSKPNTVDTKTIHGCLIDLT